MNNGNNLNVFTDNSQIIKNIGISNGHLSKIANKTEPFFGADGKVKGTKKGNLITIINE